MGFKVKYQFVKNYIEKPSKRRSGKELENVFFLVAHDTGNDGSTALNNVNYYKNSKNEMSASAHIFVDDKEIIECIPLNEKAWHVLYDKPQDNKLFGEDANDGAIGVELCYFSNDKERSLKAYKKYVWVMAYLCHIYKLDISKKITGHFILDPGRKTDPVNAFKHIGKTWEQFLKDVQAEYNECTEVRYPTIKEGSKGEYVKLLQRKLQLKADGIFGPATKKAVITYQSKNGLTADGVVGYKTWNKMF